MLKGADTDELAARGDSSASGHQTLLISYHGKTFCYRASDCIDGKPEEENSPNGSYRYTHKKYVCELFLITHIHIIRGERKASLPLRKVVMQESGYPEPAHFRFADRTTHPAGPTMYLRPPAACLLRPTTFQGGEGSNAAGIAGWGNYLNFRTSPF